jgi:hypothetical protein
MNQVIENKTLTTRILDRLAATRKKLPESWTKARGIIRDSKQRRALERHVKKMRSEW